MFGKIQKSSPHIAFQGTAAVHRHLQGPRQWPQYTSSQGIHEVGKHTQAEVAR